MLMHQRHILGSTTIGFVERDSRGVTLMQVGSQIGDCSSLMAKCLTIREAIILAIKKNSLRIIIENNSQVVINAIHGQIPIPQNILILLMI